jgi:FkbM family methyltransferase
MPLTQNKLSGDSSVSNQEEQMPGIKQRLIGTLPGRTAMRLRDKLEYFRTPNVALGTVVNDQLAEHLLTRFCRPQRTFLDVGVHIGSVIAEVRRNCPQSTVIGFEAIPEKVEWLRKKFPDVQFHGYALSDSEGEVSFFVDPAQSGFSSLDGSRDSVREIKVPMRTLDSLIDHDDVDVIKIDVEGAELGVLLGANNLVAKSRPIIMFESGPQTVLGYTKERMFQWFAERNYGIFAPMRVANTGGAMELCTFLYSHEYPRITSNYFALPMEKSEEIRARAKTLG